MFDDWDDEDGIFGDFGNFQFNFDFGGGSDGDDEDMFGGFRNIRQERPHTKYSKEANRGGFRDRSQFGGRENVNKMHQSDFANTSKFYSFTFLKNSYQ